MRPLLPFLLALAALGCPGPAPRLHNPDLLKARDVVLDAIGNAREEARLFKSNYFIFFLEDEIRVWQDTDNNGKVDVDHERVWKSFQLDLLPRGIQLRAPKWYACDPKGTPAWSSPGARPPDIVLRDAATGERFILEISPLLLEAKIIYYGAENGGP
ncbi:MAG: hypothetical protein ACYTAF_04330 [Planctomycetota bacterium]|jgi:hypothetical protein